MQKSGSARLGDLKVMTVVGTRPEAIKMAPVIKALGRARGTHPLIVVTAQHREMVDQMLRIFSIRPDYDLDVMSPRQTLFQTTSRVLLGLEKVIREEAPDLVLVQGDTTSTFAGALAAGYSRIPVGHVEAGLRTGCRMNPYPEEINRRLTSVLTDLHFAPTRAAVLALKKEGVRPRDIVKTGNTVIDALLDTARRARRESVVGLPRMQPAGKMILVTAHRRESWGAKLRDVCRALRDIVAEEPNAEVVFPVHLNPAVQETVRPELDGVNRVHLIDPQNYEGFVYLMKRCNLIITDSGGIQEEAPSLGKPVLVIREVTERPEAVEAGTALLVGTSRQKIRNAALELLRSKSAYRAMVRKRNPYGDGRAAERIVRAILRRFAAPPQRRVSRGGGSHGG
ncbi:MAG: UDP-N-acetylglucosamine 2-epimerase (non-hydrolyzing) [Candidatus Eisenbacteria sp.]|nr:UDP-N-acetylglucosamine 2-epimerase (non-hydrolyzing) [Candidatus Eisenbacteria bacterium]